MEILPENLKGKIEKEAATAKRAAKMVQEMQKP